MSDKTVIWVCPVHGATTPDSGASGEGGAECSWTDDAGRGCGYLVEAVVVEASDD